MPTLGAPLDFAKLEGRNFRGHLLGSAPSSPVTGQLYYNTGDNTLYWWDGSQWVSARGGAAATPPATTGALGTIQLAGDLAGTATSPQIAAGVITDAEVAAANKDGVVATASMRTLGLGAQQAMPGNTPISSMFPPTTDLSIGTHKLTNVVDPTNAQDAATKNYVDAVAQGLDPKQSVKAASTPAGGAVTLSGPQTVDGVSLIAGDRCLVKNQGGPNGFQHGIYVVAAGAWSRAADMNSWAEFPGAFCFVEQGTVNADTGWVCTSDQSGVLDTTNPIFVQFSGAGEYVWGNGLAATGNQVDVGGTANRITVSTDTVDIASTYVGQTSINTLGTVTTGVWNGTAIPVGYGGTGQTNTKSARETGLVASGYYSNAAIHGAGTTISITQSAHGLRASRSLVVQVQDNATGAIELPDIAINGSGDITITYAASVAANSKLVTIVG